MAKLMDLAADSWPSLANWDTTTASGVTYTPDGGNNRLTIAGPTTTVAAILYTKTVANAAGGVDHIDFDLSQLAADPDADAAGAYYAILGIQDDAGGGIAAFFSRAGAGPNNIEGAYWQAFGNGPASGEIAQAYDALVARYVRAIVDAASSKLQLYVLHSDGTVGAKIVEFPFSGIGSFNATSYRGCIKVIGKFASPPITAAHIGPVNSAGGSGGAALSLSSATTDVLVNRGATSFAVLTPTITYTGSGTLTASAAGPNASALSLAITGGQLVVSAGAGLAAQPIGVRSVVVTVTDGTLSATYTVTLRVKPLTSTSVHAYGVRQSGAHVPDGAIYSTSRPSLTSVTSDGVLSAIGSVDVDTAGYVTAQFGTVTTTTPFLLKPATAYDP